MNFCSPNGKKGKKGQEKKGGARKVTRPNIPFVNLRPGELAFFSPAREKRNEGVHVKIHPSTGKRKKKGRKGCTGHTRLCTDRPRKRRIWSIAIPRPSTGSGQGEGGRGGASTSIHILLSRCEGEKKKKGVDV